MISFSSNWSIFLSGTFRDWLGVIEVTYGLVSPVIIKFWWYVFFYYFLYFTRRMLLLVVRTFLRLPILVIISILNSLHLFRSLVVTSIVSCIIVTDIYTRFSSFFIHFSPCTTSLFILSIFYFLTWKSILLRYGKFSYKHYNSCLI